MIEGLTTYKDRMDLDKGSMRSWSISIFNSISEKDISEPLKLWSKITAVSSVQIYEFLIDNYKESFKDIKADDGLREIGAYLAFSSLVIGGDIFIDKVVVDKEKTIIVCGKDEYKAESFGKTKFSSIDEFIIKVGYVFGFNVYTPAYQSFDLYMRHYLKNSKKRDIDAESDFLLLAIVNETNSLLAPTEKLSAKMNFDFKQHLVASVLSYNQVLKEEGLLQEK